MPDNQASTTQGEMPGIIVFDSGLGGLSICREIIAQGLPLHINYLSDNAAFPYGGKAEPELVARASEVVLAAQRALAADLVVIACNTASTVALPAIRARLEIPVVGVVPAIKTAAALTASGTIGLLATPGTVARQYTHALIRDFAADKRVISVGSSELVAMAEAHIHGAPLPRQELAAILDRFEAQPGGAAIDTLVLGCTHFPLLGDQIQALRPHWKLVDSGAAIAARVRQLLFPHAQDFASSQVQDSHSAYFTAGIAQPSRLDTYLGEMGFGPARRFEVGSVMEAEAGSNQHKETRQRS